MIFNTTYQIFVGTWLCQTIFSNDTVDVIVSDHMNDSKKLAENMKKTDVFDNIYYVHTKDLRNNGLNRVNRYISYFNPFLILDKYISLSKKYDVLCIANIDNFSKLMYKSLSNNYRKEISNTELKLYIFEDGISTYSKLFETYYNSSRQYRFERLFNRNKNVIYGNVDCLYVFEPDCMLWNQGIKVLEIPHIDPLNEEFKNCINIIYDYKNMTDVYDKKYIFMEESYYADGEYVDDVGLLKIISEIVGQDNCMVKIHPRNPENRFGKLGYKTNINTSIPWEVIVLNQDMENKILITIGSTSVINPIRIFGYKIKAVSSYKCLKNKPKVMEGDLWDATQYSYEKYNKYITILPSKDSIYEYFNNELN